MQKIRNTYVLPTYPYKDYKIDTSHPEISPKDSFEKVHTLLYIARYVVQNSKLILSIFICQLIITGSYLIFAPVKYKAECTLLMHDLHQLGQGVNYFHIAPSPKRFISLIHSDLVHEAILQRVVLHDKISFGKASDYLKKSLILTVGAEGEISVSFVHPDPEFAKEIVSLVIEKCNEVNRKVITKGIQPVYLYTKKRLSDLDNEYKSLKTGKWQDGYDRGIAITREKYQLQQTLYSIESDQKASHSDDFFILNELSSYEVENISWVRLVGLNLALFFGVIYGLILYDAFNLRVKSFFKLAVKKRL